ncbi:MAG TPA: hypothetical protein VGG64_00060 [Pirellulales bacterium]
MRSEPPYRVYPWWPEDGNAWIHPDDVRLARRLIPSNRVFRRVGREGPYLVLSYGKLRLRVKPTLRQAIDGDGFDLGDTVEVCSLVGKNRPLVATIRDMHWNARSRAIQYRLCRRNMTLARRYMAEDLRPVAR